MRIDLVADVACPLTIDAMTPPGRSVALRDGGFRHDVMLTVWCAPPHA